MRGLNLRSNQLTGSIPDMSALVKLSQLFLSSNRLTGAIPTSLGTLPSLSRLFISGNQLSGCIPSSLLSLSESDLNSVGLPYCATPG